jgi:predicted Zn-dependent protease
VGELEIRRGLYAVASSRARALEAKFADSPVGPGLRAKLELAQNRPALAVEALMLARARAPDAPDIAVALAQARIAAGEVDTGIAELTALANSRPELLPVLSDALLAAKRWRDAATALERVLAQDARNVAALNNLAWAYQEAGDSRASDTARKLLALAPGEVASLDTAGWILVSSGKAQEGVAILRDALTRAPQAPGIRYHLAAGLARLGKDSEAAALLEGLNDAGDFPERAAALTLQRSLQGAL